MDHALPHVGGTSVLSDWPAGQALARVIPVPTCYLLVRVLRVRIMHRFRVRVIGLRQGKGKGKG